MSGIWSAASAALSGLSYFSQNRNMQAQYAAAAQAHDYNAAVLRQRAEATASAFNQREEAQRRSNRIAYGRDLASADQSGLGGSNYAVTDQNAVLRELDALNIRYAGQLESTGLLSQAASEEYNAETARGNRTNMRRGLFLGSASAALSAASPYLNRG